MMAETCRWFWIKIRKPFVIVFISEMDEQLNNSCEIRTFKCLVSIFRSNKRPACHAREERKDACKKISVILVRF